jgi:hypothetical protein
MDSYDPAAIVFSIGGKLITGFMDGTPITVEWDEDTWTEKVGIDGEFARARNRTQKGRITFSLLQTSASNDVLSAMVDADEAAGVPAGMAQLQDLLGTTLVGGDESYLLKRANVQLGKEIQGREWVLVVPRLIGNVGGTV